MRILRVNGEHYVAQQPGELGRYACLLLNQRINHGQVPDPMLPLAKAVCLEEDGQTALQLLAKVADVAVIPGLVL